MVADREVFDFAGIAGPPKITPVEELKTLGRYKIQGVLGKGAMGLVYDGIDPNLDRRVAIKTILTRKLDPEAARMIAVRFEREVRAVARLNHRNIVQVYDFGTEGELAFGAEVVHLDDIAMVQPRHGAHLALEAHGDHPRGLRIELAGEDGLDCDPAIQVGVDAVVHQPHGPLAEDSLDLVAA